MPHLLGTKSRVEQATSAGRENEPPYDSHSTNTREFLRSGAPEPGAHLLGTKSRVEQTTSAGRENCLARMMRWLLTSESAS